MSSMVNKRLLRGGATKARTISLLFPPPLSAQREADSEPTRFWVTSLPACFPVARRSRRRPSHTRTEKEVLGYGVDPSPVLPYALCLGHTRLRSLGDCLLLAFSPGSSRRRTEDPATTTTRERSASIATIELSNNNPTKTTKHREEKICHQIEVQQNQHTASQSGLR